MLTGGRERAEVSAHRGEGVLSHAHASHDLFDPPPPEERDAERFTSRLQGEGFQLERIVSHGHASEPGSGLASVFRVFVRLSNFRHAAPLFHESGCPPSKHLIEVIRV